MTMTAIACIVGGLLIMGTSELRPVGDNARAAGNLLGLTVLCAGLILTVIQLSSR